MNRDREIIALTKKGGSRLYYVGHGRDGTSRMVYAAEAMRLDHRALDFTEGVRTEIKR